MAIPKAFKDCAGYDIYFWSNEMSGNKLEPIHVHVIKGKRRKNATKIWVTNDGVKLCNNNSRIPANDLKRIMYFVQSIRLEIIEEWNTFFDISR